MRRLKVQYALSAERDLRDTLDFLERIGASEGARPGLRAPAPRCLRQDRRYALHRTARDELLSGLRTVGYRRKATITFRVLSDHVLIVNVFYGRRDLDGFYQRQREDEGCG